MIKKYLHPSLVLLYVFTAFWVYFAVHLRIEEAHRKARDFPSIRQEGVLRVCGEADRFSFHTEQDSTGGFYYELFKAFAARHRLKLVYFSESSMTKRLNMLEDNECDVLSGPLPVITSLRAQVAFTKSILESKLVLIQRNTDQLRRGALVRNQVNLGGKQVFLCENQAYVERLHHLAAEISDTIHVRTLVGFDSERLIGQVAAGLIDYAACDKHVANAYREKYPDIDTETPLGFNQMQAWAVKPGRKALLDSLNTFIADYKKSPDFSRLLNTYLSH